MTTRKKFKICIFVTTIILTITFSVAVTLFFTIFKPKQPIITAHPIGLENISFSFTNIPINVTIGFFITIKNRNYGSFKFKNATTNLNYHGVTIAVVPIEPRFVPARGEVNVTTSADLMVSRLVSNPSFIGDLVTGSLNMTSSAVLRGTVGFLKIFKLHATAYSACDISFFIQSKYVYTKCESKIKL